MLPTRPSRLCCFLLIVLVCPSCYTLNTTGSEGGYGPGRKVSETHHTVLGRHPETGQPTLSGLGSIRPTLQHRRIPGQLPAQTRKAQVLPQRKTTLVVIISRTSNRKENGNARSCESRLRNRSGVVSRGTAQRNNTMSWESLYRRRRLEGPRRYRCTPWSGDTRDHATTCILVIDTRLWR